MRTRQEDLTHPIFCAINAPQSQQGERTLMNQQELTKRTKSWDRLYPGMGEQFMEIVGPFYEWTPRLMPPVNGLVDQARHAVFWKSFEEIRLVALGEHGFHNWLFGGYGNAEHDPRNPPRRVRKAYNTRLGAVVKNVLSCLDNSRRSLYFDVRWSFRDSVYFPCWQLAQGNGEEARRYLPLLALWRTGNFPIGFSPGGHQLIVLTGSLPTITAETLT